MDDVSLLLLQVLLWQSVVILYSDCMSIYFSVAFTLKNFYFISGVGGFCFFLIRPLRLDVLCYQIHSVSITVSV